MRAIFRRVRGVDEFGVRGARGIGDGAPIFVPLVRYVRGPIHNLRLRVVGRDERERRFGTSVSRDVLDLARSAKNGGRRHGREAHAEILERCLAEAAVVVRRHCQTDSQRIGPGLAKKAAADQSGIGRSDGKVIAPGNAIGTEPHAEIIVRAGQPQPLVGICWTPYGTELDPIRAVSAPAAELIAQLILAACAGGH